jgi:hypothetical protein
MSESNARDKVNAINVSSDYGLVLNQHTRIRL